MTFPFPKFTGVAIEVWEWKSDFYTHCTEHVIICPCLD